MAEKSILTVEVKATELDIVKDMAEELAYLRYFYNYGPITCARMDSNFSEENIKQRYIEVFGETIPEEYQ